MIQWLQLPVWLMQMHLSSAACIVYALIANRHRLSIQTNAQTGKWADAHGVYCIYPRADLARDAGLSITTITRAVAELVNAGLILDRRLGQGCPNRLYILDLAAAADNLPTFDHADQLTLDDPRADQRDTAPDLAEQAAPEAEQAAPDLAECQDTAADDPAELLGTNQADAADLAECQDSAMLEEQAAPDLAECQDTAADDPAELLGSDQADAADLAECQDTAADVPAELLGTDQADAADLAECQDSAMLEEQARIAASTIQESQDLRIPHKKKNVKQYFARSCYQKSDNLSAIRKCLLIAYGINPDSITQEQYTTAQERTARARAVRNPVSYAASIIANIINQQAANQVSVAELNEWELEWVEAVKAHKAAKTAV